MVQWDRAITNEDVLDLRQGLRRFELEAAAPLVLILIIGDSTLWPTQSVRESIAAILPAIIRCCGDVFIAIEVDAVAKPLFQSLFSQYGLTCRPELFNSAHDALVRAQRQAPNDVLALQRQALRGLQLAGNRQ